MEDALRFEKNCSLNQAEVLMNCCLPPTTLQEWRPAEKVKEIEEKKRVANEKAFMEWSKNKTLSEQAVRYLEAVEVPTTPAIVENGVMKAEEHWMVSFVLHCS